MCRVGLDEDLYEALVDRQIDLDTALGQNNVPLVIRFPLRLPEANQRVNQSASFQRLPPAPIEKPCHSTSSELWNEGHGHSYRAHPLYNNRVY